MTEGGPFQGSADLEESAGGAQADVFTPRPTARAWVLFKRSHHIPAAAFL